MSRRARVRMTLTAAVGAVLLAIAAPTSASAQPVAGCPASWSETAGVADGELYFGGLWLLEEAQALIASPRGAELTQPGDLNDDGYICVRFLANFPEGAFDPAFVYTDNNVGGPGR
jgi:hypothetical protein